MATARKALHIATRSCWYRYELQSGVWTETEKALSYFSLSCLALDPQNPSRIIAGTENFGLFVSDNRGDDWRRPELNVPSLSTWAMLAYDGGLLVGTRPAALFRSNGAGVWSELADVRKGALGGKFPPNPDEAPRTRYLAADSQSANKLYACIEVGGMLVSENGSRLASH